ncbi:hypothetical protein MSP8887_03019 [Marinomonas spartinae]|uniref:DUF6795 domain-containing protein n=1 Tax=Marinomonas spartinae TaxID=1792290 RepID=UPI000808CF75|nr:DUF6795 domain-containing protein [Marinomonas spartinae]SBS37712.1 hypothetical protein MSP8887_03019 [Marinomonas spartinae]
MFGLIRYKVHLCCEVKGRLTVGGKPLINQLVERSLTYDEEEIDSVYTDHDGCFIMPAKSLRSRKPGNILHQPVVRIIVDTEYRGKVYNIFIGNQRGIKTPLIFQKFLSSLHADLEAEEKKHHLIERDGGEFDKYAVLSIVDWK